MLDTYWDSEKLVVDYNQLDKEEKMSHESFYLEISAGDYYDRLTILLTKIQNAKFTNLEQLLKQLTLFSNSEPFSTQETQVLVHKLFETNKQLYDLETKANILYDQITNDLESNNTTPPEVWQNFQNYSFMIRMLNRQRAEQKKAIDNEFGNWDLTEVKDYSKTEEREEI